VVCTQDAAGQHLVAACYVKSVSSHIYFWAGLGNKPMVVGVGFPHR